MSTEPASEETRHLRRSAARASILVAARRLVSQRGIGELSLSAVAGEAEFGPSTVFAHFRNKDELVLGIVAEDLALLASAMRDSLPEPLPPRAEEEDSLESALAKPAALDSEPAAVERAGNVIPLRTEAAPPPDREEMYPAPAAVDSPRVDAWLERRLRVFEHALADIEQRLKESEGASARAASLAEHGMADLFGRIDRFEHQQSEAADTLVRRVDELENRQRGATAEMRAAMNDTATRIEILESARRSGQPTVFDLQQQVLDAETIGASPEASIGSKDEPTQGPDSYKSAAQRAASAAAALAKIEPLARPAPRKLQRLANRRIRVSRRQYVIGALASIVAFVIGAMAAFSMGQAKGREMAAATVFPPSHRIVHKDGKPRFPGHSAIPKSAIASGPHDRLASLAASGNPSAELILGLRYLRGEGAAPDHPKALRWIKLAASRRDPVAEYWLATLYESGDAAGGDAGEAIRWYEAAAAQGNRKAMHALGVAYAQGMGTQKDYSIAARWFSKAAGLGLVNSQFNLGVLYERGLGVPQNLLDAYKWYAIAAAQGDEESRARIEALKTQLNADDLAAAQRAARSFRPQAPDTRANEIPKLATLTYGPGKP